MRLIFAVAAVGILLSGCAVEGKPVAAPVTDEWREAVVEAVGGLGAALGPIADGMTGPDYPALHEGCADLEAYVDSIQHKVLPGPDINVNEALQDGIDGYRKMAEQCMALTPTSGPAALRELSNTLDDADKRVKDAIKLLGIDMP